MKKRVKNTSLEAGNKFMIVKNNGQLNTEAPLLFSFSNFKLSSINIEGVFNNHYKSEEEYIRKVSTLLGKALPLLSHENYNLFNDVAKSNSLHLHKLSGKEDILRRIFQAYQFTDNAIDSFLDGGEIYQLEVPYENGAMRVVFERIDNLISFLFLDPNHHIYMNQKLVNQANSLLFEYCPMAQENMCERLDYFGTCFALEYLDEEAYEKSFEVSWKPND